jgi:hypothetical protein
MRALGARTGKARASTAASATIIAAEVMTTTRQEDWAAMKLETGRASMIPIISPDRARRNLRRGRWRRRRPRRRRRDRSKRFQLIQ